MSIKKLTADTIEHTQAQVLTRTQLLQAKAQLETQLQPILDMLAELDK